MRAQEAIGESLVLSQKTQKQMFGLDIGAAVLASFISREKNHAPSLLCIAFKHRSPESFEDRRISRRATPISARRDISVIRHQQAVLQPHHTIRALRQGKIMGCKNRS